MEAERALWRGWSEGSRRTRALALTWEDPMPDPTSIKSVTPLQENDSMAATMHLSDARHISDANGTGQRFDPRWRPTSNDPLVADGTTRDRPTGGGPAGRGEPALATGHPGVYWRRRLAVGLLLTVIGAGLWTIATWALNSSVGVDPVGADRPVAESDELYVVQPGDTLWSIATEVDPTGDVRATVDALAELNGGSSISVGQRLVVTR